MAHAPLGPSFAHTAAAPSTPSRKRRLEEQVSAERKPYPIAEREHECAALDSFLERRLSIEATACAGQAGCLYVSGAPGTGKTCSVHAAVNAWTRRRPETRSLMVNCMELTQCTVAALFSDLLQQCSIGCSPSCSPGERVPRARVHGQRRQAALIDALAELRAPLVIVIDEVDQLVKREKGAAANILEPLLSLPKVSGAPAMALIMIANAVELLQRLGVPPSLACASLLFETYSVEQLRRIVQARLATADCRHVRGSLRWIEIELRVREVAKRSGDCRQVISFCEQAAFELGSAELGGTAADSVELAVAANAAGSAAELATSSLPTAKQHPAPLAKEAALAPLRFSQNAQSHDPLRSLPQLPLEQQILLCALAAAKSEVMGLSDICTRYRTLCRSLHQAENLGSRGQVSSALDALEQRGLLSLQKARCGRGHRSAATRTSMPDSSVVELAVSREALRENLVSTAPALARCFEAFA
eukprot:NODE_6878_length_1629_cov_10.521305.p1 GENE.NODE_6878_length_1629_cov_10.521305~~NODE_6878_length_1629_cov_10.521305.p1  ORF type:complete len:475 (-),score=117.24 NODE_6878_length_1629_cov_10.521305:89-1513(-)